MKYRIELLVMSNLACSQCREKIKDEASICPHCGAKLESDGVLRSIGWLSNDILLVGGGFFLYLVIIPPILGLNLLSLSIGVVWITILLVASWV